MKQAFTDVVGNEPLKQKLLDDILQKKLSHAYILEGAAGTGKHTVALRIAAALSCENSSDLSLPLPCMKCAACRKILAGNSPDVIYVNRKEKATLGVDEIREVRADVYIPPNDLEVKLYIIEDAHLMTPQAQNALLLTLEEPPSYVLFLLLCESAAPLLETVKSRAPTLRMRPVEPDAILEYLQKNSEDFNALRRENPRETEEILAASDGSIGRALALLDPSGREPILKNRRLAREFIQLSAQKRSSLATLRYLKGLGEKRDELLLEMQAIRLCLRDLLVLKQSESAPLCFFSNREEALELSDSFATPRLLKLCDELEATCDKLRTNANVRLTLTAFAMNAGLLQ